ncbi:hypothetical protein EWV20_24840, partial [Salmonella enterica subsp. enterica serovar Schwarzengrund]|nr:hypothetical protein [Salmonella enterica subsp. enterica serovar Schwarzengrund]
MLQFIQQRQHSLSDSHFVREFFSPCLIQQFAADRIHTESLNHEGCQFFCFCCYCLFIDVAHWAVS